MDDKAAEGLKHTIIEHSCSLDYLEETEEKKKKKNLAELLCLSIQEAEKHLSDMVVSKALVAEINRSIGLVCFQTSKDNNNVLNSWAMNLEKLLDLVEKSCHQIHKETMIHKAALKA